MSKAMNDQKSATPENSVELKATELDMVSGGAIYIKFDGVDGEFRAAPTGGGTTQQLVVAKPQPGH